MSEHTKEPWELIGYSIHNADKYIAYLEDIDEEDARRIVACINACAGIGTEWLEKNAAMLQSIVSDIQNISCQLDEAKTHRDELLVERDKLLFHESQLVESLKSYMNKYGPGYSCTDTLAYDNATGVLAAIANAEKPPCA